MKDNLAKRLRRRWNTRTTFVLFVIIIVVLFSLPINFYFIIAYTDVSSSVVNVSTLLNVSNGNSTTCESLKFTLNENELINSQCTSYGYIGGICKEFLFEWNVCTIANNTSIMTNVTFSSQELFNQNIQTISDLLISTYPECQLEALPFLCQYYFPLTDCLNNKIYSATQEECERISTTVCAIPWKLAISFGEELPECDSLAQTFDNNTTEDVIDYNNSQVVFCRDDFQEQNGTCVPLCDKFTIYPDGHRDFKRACEFIMGICGTLCLVIFIIYSLKERKKIMHFPDIFSLFLVINFGIIGVTVLVAWIFQSKLFCTSSNLLETFQNEPTIFCKLSGAIFHYATVNMVIWWFIHLSILTFRLAFPFVSLIMDEDRKFIVIYWILLIIGFLLPIPAIIICLTVEKYQYQFFTLPPNFLCGPPNNGMIFYSLVMPMDILLGIGGCYLCYILLILYRLKNSSTQRQKLNKQNSLDKRVLIIFFFYLTFGVCIMVHATVTVSYTSSIGSKLEDYFQCEAPGHTPGKCSRTDFERLTLVIPDGITYLILSFTAFNMLCFIINWKKCWTGCRRRTKIKTNTNKNGKTNHTVDISL